MHLPDPLPDGAPEPAAVRRWLARADRSADAPWLHREIARRMAARLAVLRRPPSRVLDWWADRGGSLPALRAACPSATLSAVEPTAAQRSRSDRRLRAPWWRPAHWCGAAVHAWLDPLWCGGDSLPDGTVDLVWSNLSLHWQADPGRLMRRWERALDADGLLMFSAFGPDTLRELGLLYAALGWPPPAHRFIDMHDLGDALLHAGFAEPVMDMEKLTLTWADAPALLAELRDLGGNAHARRLPGLTGRARHRRLLDALERRREDGGLRGEDGRLALGFEIVYGHACKAKARRAQPRETTISVDALRATARQGKSGSGAV